MLGGGNPVGSTNTTGVGTSVNYIGKHVYANSGAVGVTDNETTLIDTTTAANSYILGGIQLGSIVKVSEDFDLQVKIDGETIMGIQLDNSNQEYFYGAYPIELIIPPQSRLEVTLINVSSSTSREWYAILTGEVYA